MLRGGSISGREKLPRNNPAVTPYEQEATRFLAFRLAISAANSAYACSVMRYQPNRDYVSNDEVQTPSALARRLVRHFRPKGRILEPCCGEGRILRHLPRGTGWCEIKRGRDFFAWHEPVDWIITNPPWSQIRPFLQHALFLADHVVFLLTINHLWTKARLRDIHNAGFGIREILLVEMPADFPQSGFQLGAVHLQRGWRGRIKLSWSDKTLDGHDGRHHRGGQAM